MDRSDPEIVFDKNGICNHCHNAQRELKMAEEEKHNLEHVVQKIQRMGKGNTYDCLIGLSGGVDSSTCLHYLFSFGLRPMTFSIDNGWNDPRADENIMRLVESLKVPFYRYTIDTAKFQELQSAFIKAGLKNIEIPTDHILLASSYEMAAKYNIKWIISGGNVATESIMPASWGYNARDLKHIKAVYKWATGKNLKGLPLCGIWKWNWYRWIKGIKIVYLLDYYTYNRAESIKLLKEKYGYQEYGDKHCENIFTNWFQNFYLFEKWGIDKRKAHFSSLINSGQMTRDEAMFLLTANPVYPQLGFEEKAMKYPKRRHEDFPMDKWYGRISKIVNICKSLKAKTISILQ